MNINRKLLSVMVLLTILAAGCAAEPATPEMDMNAMMTAAIGTVAQSIMETQTAQAPLETPTALPTITPLPSFTPYPTNTFSPLASPTFNAVFPTATFGLPVTLPAVVTGTPATATANPNALAVGCNNLAFIRDANMPAGTVLKRGEAFTKTWKVQNTGTCEWPIRYRLVLLSGSGEKLSSDFIGRIVAPWDWAEVSVSGNAPNEEGTYTSYWRMSDGGSMFGETLTLTFKVEK